MATNNPNYNFTGPASGSVLPPSEEVQSFNTPSVSRDWAWSVQMNNLARKCALVALAEACDKHGVTYRGIDKIAAAAHVNPRQLAAQVKALASAGVIDRYGRVRPNGSRSTDLIVLRMPRAKTLDLDRYNDLRGVRITGWLDPNEPNKTSPTESRRGKVRDSGMNGRDHVPPPYPLFEPPVEPQQLARACEASEASTSLPSTAAAAHMSSTASPRAGDVGTGNEGEQPSSSKPVEKSKAEVLASFIEDQTGTRPDFKPIDAERIERLLIEHGKDCFNERVTWALTNKFWREAATDNLARIVSPKGWAALTKQAENNSRADTSVSSPDYAVEADYTGGAAYAAEWEREHMAVAA